MDLSYILIHKGDDNMGKILSFNNFNYSKGGVVMDKKIIAEKANEVREKYGLIGTAVDPVLIAMELGINVYQKSNLRMNDEPVSGAIVKNNSDIIIYINAEDNNNRQRFTIAHELAHYYLHMDKNKQFVDFKRSENDNIEEREADEFAGCLLMEESHVRERFCKAKLGRLSDEITVNLLSRIFAVSTGAMYTRIRRLGLL
jgi:Zn-dependent peptidase ImmA (M78 family)